jgi:hypothetical protein
MALVVIEEALLGLEEAQDALAQAVATVPVQVVKT